MSNDRIRVLVVDDSAFMRRVLKEMIESDQSIKVIGTARDGDEGVEMALSLNPDVVTMDIEMPNVNGLEAIGAIMERRPTPIIVVSSLTNEGAKATFDALDRGATDYIGKNLLTSAIDILKIQNELVSKIKAIASRKRIIRKHFPERAPVAPPRAIQPPGKGFATQKMAVVVIGASTGGPKAVQEVLSNLPEGLDTTFLVVIHMPKAFTKAFAERLDGISSLEVKEAENGEKVKPGYVIVSQGGMQMRVRRSGVVDFFVDVSDTPHDSIYKPSVDISMVSVAEAFPGRSLGVILTGMGHDGRDGMRLIKEKGGKTLAQDEATCTIYGMPKAVIEAGLVDKVAPIEKMAAEIVNMI